MSDGEPTLVSVTVKTGDYQNTAFTIRSGSVKDFKKELMAALGTDAAAAVYGRLADALKGAPLYDVTGGSSDSKPSGGSSSGGSRGNGNKRTGDDPGVPENLTRPSCEHGPKRWANPDDKDWMGWFCVEKKRTGDCKAQWVKAEEIQNSGGSGSTPAAKPSDDEPPF